MKKTVLLFVMFSLPSALAADQKTDQKKTTAHQVGKTLEKQTIGGLRNTNRSFARSYGMAGCGLGSMVMGNSEGQVLAATTNGTSFNQMFGITFGTLNCVGNVTHAKADQIDKFILVNQSALADDIARAEGENLAVVSHLMGCPDRVNLGPVLQENFSNIFSNTDLAPNQITDHIMTVVGQDSELATECGIQI